MTQPLKIIDRRPNWLPDGHAFCPGLHEELRARMTNTPGEKPEFIGSINRCDHGQWFNLADAWTAHGAIVNDGHLHRASFVLASEQKQIPSAQCEVCGALLSAVTVKVTVHDTPERAGREGDSQELLTPNDRPFVQSAVIEDIQARLELGKRRYGTGLQTGNGRKMLLDSYEEALDLTIYLKGVLMLAEEITRLASGDNTNELAYLNAQEQTGYIIGMRDALAILEGREPSYGVE